MTHATKAIAIARIIVPNINFAVSAAPSLGAIADRGIAYFQASASVIAAAVLAATLRRGTNVLFAARSGEVRRTGALQRGGATNSPILTQTVTSARLASLSCIADVTIALYALRKGYDLPMGPTHRVLAMLTAITLRTAARLDAVLDGTASAVTAVEVGAMLTAVAHEAVFAGAMWQTHEQGATTAVIAEVFAERKPLFATLPVELGRADAF